MIPQNGWPASLHPHATRLFSESFATELAPALGPRRKRDPFVADSLSSRHGASLVVWGRLAGIAGLRTVEGGLFQANRASLHRHYPWWSVPFRARKLDRFDRPLRRGEALLEGLCVHPDLRRQGLAELLVHHMLQRARTIGAERLTLDVGEGNAAAIALYNKLGFERADRRGTRQSVTMDRSL